MNFRRIAQDWLPPILLRGARRVAATRRASKAPPEWDYCPEGWPEQEAARGWNVKSVAEAQQKTWGEYKRLVSGAGTLGLNPTDNPLDPLNEAAHNTVMSFAYVLALAARNRSELSLLDWGGGLGHYALLSRALLPEVPIRYSCRDLPLICEAARETLAEDSFFSNDEACYRRDYDLVLASSSLQYVEDWKAQVMRLSRLTRSYLFITRIPIIEKADTFVVIQRPYACGYETEYPGWFLNHQEFVTHAEQIGLRLQREFLIQERPHVPNAPEQAAYRGFLFRTALA